MPIVRINSLREGMTLSKDVNDLNGRPLLKKGFTLLERHVTLFKSWGVTEVEVEAGSDGLAKTDRLPSAADIADNSKEAKKASQAYYMEKFALNDMNDLMISEFFTLCVARKANLPW